MGCVAQQAYGKLTALQTVGDVVAWNGPEDQVARLVPGDLVAWRALEQSRVGRSPLTLTARCVVEKSNPWRAPEKVMAWNDSGES